MNLRDYLGQDFVEPSKEPKLCPNCEEAMGPEVDGVNCGDGYVYATTVWRCCPNCYYQEGVSRRKAKKGCDLMNGIPAENTIVTCRACGAMIFFARTENMKNMPLDAKPVRAMVVGQLGPGETQHKVWWIDTFKSHFATCPKAEQFRRDQA